MIKGEKIMEFKNKRDHILHLMEQGTFTREQIIEQTGVTVKSFGSVCSTLRLMGKYPNKKDDGTYHLISKEEYEALTAEKAAKEPKEILTPEQRLERAQKAESKAASALTNRKEKFEKDPSRENELAFKIAEMELELASIRLSRLETADLPKPVEEPTASPATDEQPW